eukprot:GHVP01040189.1.p1 GENE.GHVP01040189.1~~GHVP01040189.1.p1  ORF type:complete len:429 (+),score=61.50 GHVP01040189.1:149-1435(+)
MDERYDIIFLGTGLSECILAGILALKGYKILQIDEDDHYGAECASLNLSQLYSLFGETYDDKNKSKEYSIDLVPKFIMASGEFVDILTKTKVTKYMSFQSIHSSYVYIKGKIAKVPYKKMDTLKSNLLGIIEKARVVSFFNLAKNSPDGISKKYDLEKMTSKELYKEYGLCSETRDFIGHAIALFHNEDYLLLPASELIRRIRLYIFSVSRFGNSPYLYPLYGLGDLPQGFSRLGAVNGGVYMLGKKIEDIVKENGVFKGIKIQGETIYGDKLVGSPKYLENKCISSGKIIRSVCILHSAVPNTHEADSAQIIIPQKQVNRKNDIYITLLSHAHKVCPRGVWIAIVSTVVETDLPEKELEPAYNVLGTIHKKFITVTKKYIEDSTKTENNIFVSPSIDETSHFEEICLDIRKLYQSLTGESFDDFLNE